MGLLKRGKIYSGLQNGGSIYSVSYVHGYSFTKYFYIFWINLILVRCQSENIWETRKMFVTLHSEAVWKTFFWVSRVLQLVSRAFRRTK